MRYSFGNFPCRIEFFPFSDKIKWKLVWCRLQVGEHLLWKGVYYNKSVTHCLKYWIILNVSMTIHWMWLPTIKKKRFCKRKWEYLSANFKVILSKLSKNVSDKIAFFDWMKANLQHEENQTRCLLKEGITGRFSVFIIFFSAVKFYMINRKR